MTNQIIEELEVANLLERIGVNSAETMKDISDKVETVTLYHSETGEPRVINKVFAEPAAKKMIPGTRRRVFTDQPTVEYPQGQVKCMLHAEHDRREEWDKIGLKGRTCAAGHLASEYDMGEHMRRKHRREFALIQDYEAKKAADEQRAIQIETQNLLRQQAEAAMAMVQQPRRRGE